LQDTSPNHPYGGWITSCCIYCQRDTSQPHQNWCRWGLWSRIGANHMVIRANRGKVPVRGSSRRYRERRYKHGRTP